MKQQPSSAREVAGDDEGGFGGDEPFCEHGNLLDSETCDECIDEHWKLTDRFTAAAITKE